MKSRAGTLGAREGEGEGRGQGREGVGWGLAPRGKGRGDRTKQDAQNPTTKPSPGPGEARPRWAAEPLLGQLPVAAPGDGSVAKEPGVAGFLGRGWWRKRERCLSQSAAWLGRTPLALRPCFPPPEPAESGPEASRSHPPLRPPAGL